MGRCPQVVYALLPALRGLSWYGAHVSVMLHEQKLLDTRASSRNGRVSDTMHSSLASMPQATCCEPEQEMQAWKRGRARHSAAATRAYT